MALSKVQGAQIETPVDIAAVNLTGVSTATDLNATRVNVTGVATFANATITGDLTVQGTTTTLDTTVENVDLLEVGANSAGAAVTITQAGAGDFVNVGTAGSAFLISNSGSIGIGTVNPTSNFKLDVNGDLSLGEAGGSDNTYIDQKQNGHLNIINSGAQSNSGRVRINKTNSISGDTTYFRDFEVYDGKNNLLLIADGSSSNIGINTSANINGRLTIQANDDSELLLQVRAHNGRAAQLKSTASASSTDPFVFQTNNSWGFDVDTLRTLTLSSDYKVGIATATPSCKLQIIDTATHTAYGGGTPNVSDCMLAIANLPTSEAINNHATIQFNVDGGTYNRVCSISAVVESASNRNGMLTFCTDDAGSRTEKLRITGDGKVGINSTIPSHELDVRGNVIIGNSSNITPTGSGVGQLRIRSAGYTPYIAANATAMYVGHNSSSRDLILQTNETDRLRIKGNTGSVLIGSTTTNVKLYVYDNTGMQQTIYAYQNGTGAYAGLFQCNAGDSTQYAVYGYVNTSSTYSSGGILGYSINSNTYAILGYWSTAAYYSLYGNGLVYAAGGFSSSDERLKDVSSRIEGGVLDDLTSLVPVEYTWKDNTEQGRGLEGVTQIGLIAQEVEVNFPHLVMENFHTRITGINSTSLNEEIGMCKSVEYGKLTCYLLVALSEAYDKIKALEQHVGIAST